MNERELIETIRRIDRRHRIGWRIVWGAVVALLLLALLGR